MFLNFCSGFLLFTRKLQSFSLSQVGPINAVLIACPPNVISKHRVTWFCSPLLKRQPTGNEVPFGSLVFRVVLKVVHSCQRPTILRQVI